jgi:DNA-binding CsgD family transcriptional regulator
VVSAIAEELGQLSDGVRRALEGAAVAGDPFEPELAAAAAGLSGESVAEALDELLARDLIRRTSVPRRFRFRHPLVRRAVYESAPGGWVLGAHARSAAALAARGASAAARAHHVEQAAGYGDLAAVAVLREAGEMLAARTPSGAARWFSAALRLLPDATPPDQRIGLQTALAMALGAAGRFAEAHTVLLESLAIVPEDAITLRVRLTADCAGLEQLLGRHRAAHARLDRGLEQLPGSSSPEAVALMLELAADRVYRMDYGSMHAWSQRALDAARGLGDQLLTARAAARLVLASTFCGAVATAEALRPEVAALVDGMSDHELAAYLERVAASLVAAELFLDRYEEAGRHAERMLAVALATGRTQLVPVLFWAGAVRTARGRLPEAVEVLDAAVEIARLSGNPTALGWNLLGRSFAATAAGDVDTALHTAGESVEVLRGPDASLTSVWASVAFAAALLPAGDAVRAAEVLRTAAGGYDMSRLPVPFRAGAGELLTRCWLALDRVENAARAAAAAEAVAHAFDRPMSRAMADRAVAAVALERDEPRLAADRALGSAAAADAGGAHVEAALSRALAGRSIARAGETDLAGAQLAGAAATFDACGAIRRRDAAERELRQLGRRHPHRRTRPGRLDGTRIESLTARELQVARLIVDRRTNSQIAGELFLSPKTVETHIRNLFSKLGVTSRVEIARAIERADRDRQETQP